MYYKHSGRFNLGGVCVGVAVGIAASLILAYAYGRGLILITEVHFALFATMAFGAAVGAAAGYGMVLGKVRNERVMYAAAAVVSCIALYVSWAVWVRDTLQNGRQEAISWTALAARPDALWHFIRVINQYGTWGIDKGSSTNGWALWIVWTVEAATIIGLALTVAKAVLNYRPFCEACTNWCGRGTRIVLAPPNNLTQLKRTLESGDLKSLASLPPGNKGADHLLADLNSCPHCCQFHTLSLAYVLFRRSKFGRVHIQKTEIMKQLVVGPEAAESIRQLSEKVNQAARMAPPKANSATAGK